MTGDRLARRCIAGGAAPGAPVAGCDHDQLFAGGAAGLPGTVGAAACHWVAGPGIGAPAGGAVGMAGALIVGG